MSNGLEKINATKNVRHIVDTISSLIDTYPLHKVLHILGVCCEDKADSGIAEWSEAAKKIAELRESILQYPQPIGRSSEKDSKTF